MGLIAVYALFCFLAPDSFTTFGNFQTIIRQTTIVGLLSLGMTAIIISGGIDLSVGSVVALTTVIIAHFLQIEKSPFFAVSAGLMVATFCGVLNGLLISLFRITPFIVTLGSLLIVRGAAKGFAHEQKIDAPVTGLNELLAMLNPDHAWMLVPPGVWILILLALLFTFVLRQTRFGLFTFAIGSSEANAKLCGVPISKMKIALYALCSAMAGMGGLMQFSRLTVGDPTVANGLELDAIAAVVIGGGSLSGGEGTIVGSLIGALIMTVIRSGCAQVGLANWIQEIVTGLIIIVAVGIDRYKNAPRT